MILGVTVYGSHVEDYRSPERELTDEYYGYTIGDKSDEGAGYLITS